MTTDLRVMREQPPSDREPAIPWIYLVLKTQYAAPWLDARLALDLPRTWPANDRGVPQ